MEFEIIYLEFPLYCMCSIYVNSLHCSPVQYCAFLLLECLCLIFTIPVSSNESLPEERIRPAPRKKCICSKPFIHHFWNFEVFIKPMLGTRIKNHFAFTSLPPLLLIPVRIYVSAIVLNALDSISHFTLITAIL